jgi:hypothetical protein
MLSVNEEKMLHFFMMMQCESMCTHVKSDDDKMFFQVMKWCTKPKCTKVYNSSSGHPNILISTHVDHSFLY